MPANTVAPTLIELRGPGDLKHLPEVFGPVLHLLPYDEPRYDDLLAAIREMGYGLTVGVESRDRRWRERTKDALPYHGNIYAHRPQIGAVPGEGDFGGGGLSGSGLRSGTADYLRQFSSEQAVIDNLAATGGVLDAYRAH